MTTRRDDLRRIIHNHERRLQILKEQKALSGWSVDPKVLIEIEDIEAEIRDLQIELSIIESRHNELEFARVASEAAHNGQGTIRTAGPPRILVVEDEPDFSRNLCLTLEIAGYQTVTARDGAEALAMLQLQPVDLILSDISMPCMSGYQLYNRIYENPRWVSIPFVFLSARTMDSDVNYGKELGADDYLTKPVRTESLISVIRGKLRRQAAAKA